MKSKQELLSIHDKQPAVGGRLGFVDAVMASADQATCTEDIASIEKFLNAGCFRCSGLVYLILLRIAHPAQAHTTVQDTIERIAWFTGTEDQITCFKREDTTGRGQRPHAGESSQGHDYLSLQLYLGNYRLRLC